MKKIRIASALALGLALLCTPQVFAAVTVTAATGGSSISADLATNGAASAFTTLGNIVIAESGSAKGDIAAGSNQTLILTAPSGWRFNPGAGSVSFMAGKDITAASISVTLSNVTATISVGGTASADTLTISGIQMQATEGGAIPFSGTILRTSANPGTATITGIVNDSTPFGSLSQAVGTLRLYLVLAGQSFTDASTLAASGISGTPTAQTAGSAFTITKLVAADRQFNIASTYSGSKTISYGGPGGSPSYITAVSFTSGQSTTTLTTTLTKAETTTITATDGTNPGSGSSNLTVSPGSASKLQILLPGEVTAPVTTTGKTAAMPTAQTVATAIANGVVVNAVDANWNVVTAATPNVTITSSGASATIADDNGGVAGNMTLNSGTGTLSSFTFATAAATQT